jgi:two-component system LytT family response regulator
MMAKKKVIVIDDEKRTRDLISRMLQSFDLDIDVIGMGENVESGKTIINELKPDLIILDIQMPDGTGFDLLRNVRYTDFKTIFVTAHEEYAIKAIKFSALDYILKPVDPEELSNSVEKALSTLSTPIYSRQIDALQENLNNSKKKKLVLKTTESVFVVSLEEIIRCESHRNYTTFYLTGAKKIMVSKTLKDFETILSSHHFLRIQQSHLINMDFVDRYDKTDGGAVVMIGGSRVPLSSSKRDIFFKILENL